MTREIKFIIVFGLLTYLLVFFGGIFIDNQLQKTKPFSLPIKKQVIEGTVQTNTTCDSRVIDWNNPPNNVDSNANYMCSGSAVETDTWLIVADDQTACKVTQAQAQRINQEVNANPDKPVYFTCFGESEYYGE